MSDVLVDSSVWIDFFRKKSSPEGEALDRLLEENRVCTVDLIKVEIVGGAKTLQQFEDLKSYFDALPLLEEPQGLWENMMHLQFNLHRKGIQGVGIPDLMIAVMAQTYHKVIFTRDHDFKRIRNVFPIQLMELNVNQNRTKE
ncbi:MAG: PIN domain-containing protein [Chlamydiae bacterium]|nr:PIN domain-containing protein [Chlamydiota bacterium]MBI3278026.1 PIN domain-containing protein [Chlamydiota bacterium]